MEEVNSEFIVRKYFFSQKVSIYQEYLEQIQYTRYFQFQTYGFIRKSHGSE